MGASLRETGSTSLRSPEPASGLVPAGDDPARVWKHDDLAADLAQHLRCDHRMVWTDMQLGPSGSARPDVYTLERSYSRPMPTAYECKISRSDLRSDTTSGKWQKYMAFAGAVVFAVPDGLCTVADIPVGCGLMVRKAQTWRHVRKATRQAVNLPMDTCMKLLIDGVHRAVERRDPTPRRVETWREHEAIRKKFGAAVDRAARDIVAAQVEATDLAAQRRAGWERVDREVTAHREALMTRVRDEMAQFEAVKRELIDWLGIEGQPNAFGVRRRIDEIKATCDANERVQRAERKLAAACRSIEQALTGIGDSPPQGSMFREVAA